MDLTFVCICELHLHCRTKKKGYKKDHFSAGCLKLRLLKLHLELAELATTTCHLRLYRIVYHTEFCSFINNYTEGLYRCQIGFILH